MFVFWQWKFLLALFEVQFEVGPSEPQKHLPQDVKLLLKVQLTTIITSSKAHLAGFLCRTDFNSCSNNAGELLKPEIITVNCHNPRQIDNAVFSLSLGYRATCQ
jgi:hypothetical protein